MAKPPATTPYTLWDCKADRMPVTNWNDVPMPEEALSRLQVGDAVRLLLMDSDGGSHGCWEKIYIADFSHNGVGARSYPPGTSQRRQNCESARNWSATEPRMKIAGWRK